MVIKLEIENWYPTTLNDNKASKEREGVETNNHIKNNSQQLFEIGELNVSDAFLLSNCIILHHWWIALINGKTHTFYWLNNLEQSSIIFMDMLLTTFYIWFAKKPKKPPDKLENKSILNKIIDWISYMIYFIEDTLYETTKINIDLCYWIYILSIVTTEYIFDFINIFLQVEYKHVPHSEKDNAKIKKWKTPYSQDQVEIYEVNQHDPLRFRNGKRIQSNLVFSMSAKSSSNDAINDVMNADTDSYTAAIDTCTSESICKHKECFVGDIKPCKNVYVQGVGGRIKASGYGSVKMRIEDDQGKAFDLLIHNVIYLPDSPINLISPQRWSGGSKDPTGTGELTIDGTTLLFWNERKSTKIIPHHPELGIPIMTFNDGYTKSSAFLSAAQSSMFCLPCTDHLSYLHTSQTVTDKHNRLHIIPVEDEDEELFTKIDHSTNKKQRTNIIENENEYTSQDNHLKQIDDESITSTSTSQQSLKDLAEDDDFHSSWAEDNDFIDIPQNEIEQIMSAVDQQTSKLQRELLSHHYRLKHLPFPALQRLAKKGVIPKQLEKIKIPLCYACMMGKQTKRPWRGKGKKNIRHIRKPEDCFAGANTSTDHMISPYGGLIPQLKGRLMRAKYYAATIFVDHHTDFTYVHLMRDSTAESTLEAKNAYEHLLLTFRHKVHSYHADNGRFAESVFVQDIKDKAV